MIFIIQCDIISRSVKTWRSRVAGRARTIGNRVTLNGVREFESLLLRQTKIPPKRVVFLFGFGKDSKGVSQTVRGTVWVAPRSRPQRKRRGAPYGVA